MIDVHWDCETFSEADIKKVGGFVYSQHESTELICFAYAYSDEPPQLWLPGNDIPYFMRPDLYGRYQIHCWNSGFEYAIWKHVLKSNPPPISCWTDTAALATVMAYPSALGKCGQAMGLPQDKAKDKRGSYLIQKLCVPQGKKRTRNRDPEFLKEFYGYCKQDVIAERAIAKRLVGLSPLERQVWELDQEINFRGIQIDIPNVLRAMAINEKKSANLMRELQEITGLANPNSWQQFLPWLQERGYTGDNLQADTLRDFVTELEKTK